MCYSRSLGCVLEREPRLPRPPILAAAIPGQKHTGQSAGEMKISTAKKRMMQCSLLPDSFRAMPRASQLGQGAVGGLRPCALQTSCRDAESHPVPLLCSQRGQDPGPSQRCTLLWKGTQDASKGWAIVTGRTVAGLLGPPHRWENGSGDGRLAMSGI
jgi:hypothetical protein